MIGMILRAADLADDAERRERSDHARGEHVLGSRDLGEVEVAARRALRRLAVGGGGGTPSDGEGRG